VVRLAGWIRTDTGDAVAIVARSLARDLDDWPVAGYGLGMLEIQSQWDAPKNTDWAAAALLFACEQRQCPFKSVSWEQGHLVPRGLFPEMALSEHPRDGVAECIDQLAGSLASSAPMGGGRAGNSVEVPSLSLRERERRRRAGNPLAPCSGER
jgi:hypothetical protein